MTNNDNIKKRVILNLEVLDLLKVMDVIDGKTNNLESYDVSSMAESEFLEKEISLVREIRTRLENIFKE